MKKVCFCLLLIGFCLSLQAQVHYRENGMPWTRKAGYGPDKVVPGWYYNLGITGIRAQLIADKPKYLEIKYIFKDSVAYGKVQTGDYITGVGGKEFKNGHINGYGMSKFGATGPIEEFAAFLEEAQSPKGKGILKLDILRAGKKIIVSIDVGTEYGPYSSTYPANCRKSEKITKELLEFVHKSQRPNGSFGSPVDNLFIPLALMASGDRKYDNAIKKNIYMQAKNTKATDRPNVLINWSYMTAGIVISEYYLKTKDPKMIKELQEIYDFLYSSQYMDPSQINPKVNARRIPKGKGAQGGWGHNPGFEGYGPIGMTTGEGALAWALMSRCGIKVDRKRLDLAYAFLKRGTGKNGYTWYKDHVSNHNKYADMGRTGVSAIANWLSPYSDSKYKEHALHQAKFIGEKPKSFPDTHASPILGMGFTALAANIDADSLTKLLQANKFWFALAQCHDGSFYYQPNRDSNGYKGNNRIAASGVTAFIFQMYKKNLVVTGRK